MKYFRKTVSCIVMATFLLTSLLSLNAASSTVISNKVAVTEHENQPEIDDSSYNIKMDDSIQLATDFINTYTNYQVNDEDTRVTLEDQVYWYHGNEDMICWQVSWNFNRKDRYFNLDVQVNAFTGEIMQYESHSYNHENDLEKLPSLTSDEAKALAINFVSQMHPDKVNSLEANESFNYMYDARYSIDFLRKVNGIPTSDRISIEVDGQTGEIASYRIRWTEDVTFEDPNEIKSQEEAKAVFVDSISMELGYEPVKDENYEIEGMKLVYHIDTELYSVHAKDLLTEQLPVIDEVDDGHIDEEFILSDEEKLEYLELANLMPIDLADEKLTHDEANQLGQNYIKVLLGEEFYIEDLQYRTDYEGDKTWEIRCTTDATSRYHYDGANIQLEPNGKLSKFYRYNEEKEMDKADEGHEPIAPEELYTKAAKIMAFIYPEEFSQMESTMYCRGVSWGYNDMEYDNLMYTFSMNQMDELDNYGISVEIGAYSGSIYNLRYEWIDIEVPDLEPILTAEEAKAKILDVIHVELQYGIKEDEESGIKKGILNYYFRTKVDDEWISSVDAINGELLNYKGRYVNEVNSTDTLDEHWAANELKLMDEQEIINLDSINVDEGITVNEFIYMLVKAAGYKYYRLDDAPLLLFTNVSEEDAYYDTLRLAAYDHIIDNEAITWNGDRHLTREEMAMYTIKMLGYGNVADLEGIYQVSFTDAADISSDMLGYVALCEGFGIIEGIDGAFHPKDELTYAEAAMAVYKILTKAELVR